MYTDLSKSRCWRIGGLTDDSCIVTCSNHGGTGIKVSGRVGGGFGGYSYEAACTVTLSEPEEGWHNTTNELFLSSEHSVNNSYENF